MTSSVVTKLGGKGNEVVAEANSTGLVIKTLWVGTQAQYDAIATKDANTQYNTDSGIYVGTTLVSGGGVSSSEFIHPETYGAVSYASRALAEAGTDSTAAIKLALDAWYVNGGTLFLSGWFRITEALLLENSNAVATIGTQPPLRITGIGGHGTGRGEKANYGSGLVWTAETGSAVAKLDTRGSGIIVLDNCTFASSASSGNTKPFIHTTFTVIRTGDGFALDGAVYGALAVEDGFVLGGQNDHESTGLDRTSSDCGFQGYGTVIDGVHCNGIRRLAVLQRYANAIRISNNVLWNTCGNNSATGAAIEVNGAPIAPVTYSVGSVINNNLIELTHYQYGIYLKYAFQVFIHGNDGYDAGAGTLSVVYVDATSLATKVIASLAPSGGRPYVLPNPADGGDIFLIGCESAQYNFLKSIYAGVPGYPNMLGPTTFEYPTTTVFQSKAASGNGKLLTLKRSAADTNPSAEVFSVDGIGQINLGNLSSSGNIANALPSGASWWSNGRCWGFSGLTGSNMEWNSGTGGSYNDIKGYAIRHYDHTGALVATMSSAAAGYNIARPLTWKPASSVTPAANGELTFEATSNTSLTVKLKGTDGTVRSVVLTLA